MLNMNTVSIMKLIAKYVALEVILAFLPWLLVRSYLRSGESKVDFKM